MSEYSDVIESFLDSIEGVRTPNYNSNETLLCDFCSEPIHKNSEVTMYVSNWDISGQDESQGFGLQRLYGPCCERKSVRWPCHSVIEMILSARYTPQKRLINWSVEDLSSLDDGEPWNPIEVYEAVSKVDYEEHQGMHAMMRGEPQQQGPEDIVDHLVHMGVDIRNVVNEDGNIDISPEQRKEIDEQMAERMEELREKYREEGPPI